MLATNKMAEFKIKSKEMNFPDIHMMHVKDFLNLTKEQILTPLSIQARSHLKDEVPAKTKQ